MLAAVSFIGVVVAMEVSDDEVPLVVSMVTSDDKVLPVVSLPAVPPTSTEVVVAVVMVKITVVVAVAVSDVSEVVDEVRIVAAVVSPMVTPVVLFSRAVVTLMAVAGGKGRTCRMRPLLAKTETFPMGRCVVLKMGWVVPLGIVPLTGCIGQ